jgi:uroporphyrinogen-III decarboxylase
MQMTSRERLLAALRGEAVDRLPWSPFLAYWWDYQTQAVQKRGQVPFFRELGADALLRGFITAFTCSDIQGISQYAGFTLPVPGVEFRREEKGNLWRIEFITPVGQLVSTAQYSPDGNTRFMVEHPVKSKEDYKILRYIVERMLIQPDYGVVQREIAEVGEGGLSVPLISPFLKTPFQALVEHYVGTEQLVYDLTDFPEEVEETLAVMSEKAMQAVRISVDSPAQAFITWEDTSTTNISPAMFKRYIAPELNRWGEVVHAAGKLFLHHACGHVRALLSTMAQESVDAIESLSPPPTGNVEIWDARQEMGQEMGLIGGIEPVNFFSLDLRQLRAYVENLIERMGSHRYILANSDSCPPGVALEKFLMVSEVVQANPIR